MNAQTNFVSWNPEAALSNVGRSKESIVNVSPAHRRIREEIVVRRRNSRGAGLISDRQDQHAGLRTFAWHGQLVLPGRIARHCEIANGMKVRIGKSVVISADQAGRFVIQVHEAPSFVGAGCGMIDGVRLNPNVPIRAVDRRPRLHDDIFVVVANGEKHAVGLRVDS